MNRIFVVSLKNKETGEISEKRLINGPTGNACERHAIEVLVTAKRATAEDVADLIAEGKAVENAEG